MKKISKVTFCLIVSLAVGIIMAFSLPAFAEDFSRDQIIQELKILKKKVMEFEGELNEERQKAEESTTKTTNDRISVIEEKIESGLLGKWSDKITLSGVIEVEAGYEDMDYDNSAEEDEDSSDIALATFELGIDADITKHIKGHALLLWEEDDTEPVDLDEGFITLDGADVVPMYLTLGKMYVPFGNFESHFISDPITLELGEIRESALQVGYSNEFMEISGSLFNGDIDETREDSHVDNFVANAMFSIPSEVLKGCEINFGVSYISNIADSDGLEEETSDTIDDYVGGVGMFVSIALMDKFFLEAEYISATDDFKTGELFDGIKEYQPEAWNIELACALLENLEAAIKYEGGDDLAGFQPEEQYGFSFNYGIFENTSVAFEYLHGEFENDDERELITAQLAMEF